MNLPQSLQGVHLRIVGGDEKIGSNPCGDLSRQLVGRAERNIDGDVIRYVAESPWTPTPEELNSVTGKWYSDEADATVSIVVENGQAYLTQRPATRLPLRPQYKDASNLGDQPGTIVWFTRTAGKLTMHAGTSRLRDMPFVRIQ